MVRVRVRPRVKMAARAPVRNACADPAFLEIPAKKVLENQPLSTRIGMVHFTSIKYLLENRCLH